MVDIDDKTLITTTLVGWKEPMAAMRNNPGFTISGFGDLTLDHTTETTRLSIEAHVSEHFLRFHILDKSDTGGTFIVQYENSDQLKKLLQAFVTHQDTVTSENFKALIRDILAVASKVQIETPEGLRDLTDTKNQ